VVEKLRTQQFCFRKWRKAKNGY